MTKEEQQFKEWCVKTIQSKVRSLAYDGVLTQGLTTPEILDVIQDEIKEILTECESELEYKDHE